MDGYDIELGMAAVEAELRPMPSRDVEARVLWPNVEQGDARVPFL
jgi:hypothetical protein